MRQIHCHTPDSSSCHRSWSKHQLQALHTSFSPELMHPLHLELLRWHFPNRYLPPNSSFLEVAFVLFKQSHRPCLQLLMDSKKQELCCILLTWEREDAFAAPSRKAQNSSTSWPSALLLALKVANSPGLQHNKLVCPAQPALEMTGEDEAILPAPPSPSFLLPYGLHKTLQHSQNMPHRATSPFSSLLMSAQRYLQNSKA